MKISELISKEAQDILNHSYRKQMVLDAEKELKTNEPSPAGEAETPKHARHFAC